MVAPWGWSGLGPQEVDGRWGSDMSPNRPPGRGPGHHATPHAVTWTVDTDGGGPPGWSLRRQAWSNKKKICGFAVGCYVRPPRGGGACRLSRFGTDPDGVVDHFVLALISRLGSQRQRPQEFINRRHTGGMACKNPKLTASVYWKRIQVWFGVDYSLIIPPKCKTPSDPLLK